jgi:hypothetical protein
MRGRRPPGAGSTILAMQHNGEDAMNRNISTADDTANADSVLPKARNEAPRITGVYAPTLTAYGGDGSVNLDGVRQFVGFLLKHGVHGLTPLGSAG